MIEFSIIIPHKDLSLRYLLKCLESIPQRDDLEVIIVDDNSDPQNVDFAELQKLASRNTHLILDKSGLGPGYARNIGMESAKGKWVLFADADDYFCRKSLDALLSQLLLCTADIVFVGVDIVDLNGTVHKDLYGYSENTELVEIQDISSFIVDQHQSWRKVMRADFVQKQNLSYPRIKYCEDQSFSVKAIVLAERIMLFPTVVYTYVHRSSSITKKLAVEDLKNAFNDALDTNRFLMDNNRPERLKVVGYILSLMWKNSTILFYRSVFKEWRKLDKSTMSDDYSYACLSVGIERNPFVLCLNRLRVFMGKLKNKLL